MKIPILSIPDNPMSVPTQQHLPIADITRNMLLFKDGGAAIVMESSALNFSLLSEKEKEAVIAAYAALINSLNFSMQIVVRSKRKNIQTYMKYLDKAHGQINNPKLFDMMEDYKTFVAETIKRKNVLEKKFYVILPLSALELGVGKSMISLTKKKGPLPYPKSYVIKKAKITLYPKRDHLKRQVGRLGIKLRQLNTNELISLFYSIYNEDALPSPKKN